MFYIVGDSSLFALSLFLRITQAATPETRMAIEMTSDSIENSEVCDLDATSFSCNVEASAVNPFNAL